MNFKNEVRGMGLGGRMVPVTRVVMGGEGHAAPKITSTPQTDHASQREAGYLKGPSMVKRAGNFWRDMKTVLWLYFAGEPIAEVKEIVLAKLRICAGDSEQGIEPCEVWRSFWPHQVLGWGVCGDEQCGCLLGFKARLRSRPDGQLGCPRKKWDKVKRGTA